MAKPDCMPHSENVVAYCDSNERFNNNWKDCYTIIKDARIKAFDKKPIIGWKKARFQDKNGFLDNYCLVELEIGARTRRFQPTDYKCRASRAKVVGIYHLNGNRSKRDAYSDFDRTFAYRVGKVMRPRGEKFNTNYMVECTAGIHFFLTKSEALGYSL